MPRRVILTDAERHDFLALPTDDETLIRHWTLDDDDHRLLQTRRRNDTRLGLALQLCALRYPGRLIRRRGRDANAGSERSGCAAVLPFAKAHPSSPGREGHASLSRVRSV